MAESRRLTDDEQGTWRAFLWTSRLLNGGLDRQLKRGSGMPHTYYMTLVMLSETPNRSMTMSELAQLLRSSLSRLSRAVNRLEECGWVRRDTRRGAWQASAEVVGSSSASLAAQAAAA
ncbi:MarR family transcriptional regulator [Streptomyces sp900105755]|uniref:MarR family transcriptional regulator n=1 Tax=Streptomyces sp. 900105755 TaxID=3154389 RepID=UPI00331C6EF0